MDSYPSLHLPVPPNFLSSNHGIFHLILPEDEGLKKRYTLWPTFESDPDSNQKYVYWVHLKVRETFGKKLPISHYPRLFLSWLHH